MANKTTPTTTVEVPSNAGGSNKSRLEPMVAVPAGVKKWLLLAFITLVVVICIVLIVAVARSGNNAKQTTAVAQIVCPDVSAQEARSCVIKSEWSNWIKFADGARDNGKQICFTPVMQFEKKDADGWTFWRFKTGDGQVAMKYRLLPASEQCPDVL